MRSTIGVLTISLLVLGCEGPKGSTGPEGPQGEAGPEGPEGPIGPSTGAAGGDLTGTYPNPTIAEGVVTLSKLDPALFDAAPQTPSLRTIGTGGNQVVAGDDARLSDARVPAGAASGDLTGSYPAPTIANGAVTALKIDPALSDAAAGTASLRSLGSGANQAAAGNDPRLSNARTPTGSAGGALSGTYPNPTLAANAITSTQQFATGALPAVRLRLPDTAMSAGQTSVAWTAEDFDTDTLWSAAAPTEIEVDEPGFYELNVSLTALGVAAGSDLVVFYRINGTLADPHGHTNGNDGGGCVASLSTLLALNAFDEVTIEIFSNDAGYTLTENSVVTLHWVGR